MIKYLFTSKEMCVHYWISSQEICPVGCQLMLASALSVSSLQKSSTSRLSVKKDTERTFGITPHLSQTGVFYTNGHLYSVNLFYPRLDKLKGNIWCIKKKKKTDYVQLLFSLQVNQRQKKWGRCADRPKPSSKQRRGIKQVYFKYPSWGGSVSGGMRTWGVIPLTYCIAKSIHTKVYSWGLN